MVTKVPLFFSAEASIAQPPKVTQIPATLSPRRFLATMETRMLAATPVNMHEEVRQGRASAASLSWPSPARLIERALPLPIAESNRHMARTVDQISRFVEGS